MYNHPGRAITRYDFGKLFTAAYQSTSSMSIAVQSFRATGIYPLNKDIFGDDVFSPAGTTYRPLLGEQDKTGGRNVVAQVKFSVRKLMRKAAQQHHVCWQGKNTCPACKRS